MDGTSTVAFGTSAGTYTSITTAEDAKVTLTGSATIGSVTPANDSTVDLKAFTGTITNNITVAPAAGNTDTTVTFVSTTGEQEVTAVNGAFTLEVNSATGITSVTGMGYAAENSPTITIVGTETLKYEMSGESELVVTNTDASNNTVITVLETTGNIATTNIFDYANAKTAAWATSIYVAVDEVGIENKGWMASTVAILDSTTYDGVVVIDVNNTTNDFKVAYDSDTKVFTLEGTPEAADLEVSELVGGAYRLVLSDTTAASAFSGANFTATYTDTITEGATDVRAITINDKAYVIGSSDTTLALNFTGDANGGSFIMTAGTLQLNGGSTNSSATLSDTTTYTATAAEGSIIYFGDTGISGINDKESFSVASGTADPNTFQMLGAGQLFNSDVAKFYNVALASDTSAAYSVETADLFSSDTFVAVNNTVTVSDGVYSLNLSSGVASDTAYVNVSDTTVTFFGYVDEDNVFTAANSSSDLNSTNNVDETGIASATIVLNFCNFQSSFWCDKHGR